MRDLVLLTIDERKTQTESGLFLAEKAWEDAITTGTVEAIGDDVTHVKVGEKVRFNPYATHPALEENQRFIKEKDILAHG